MFPSRMDIQVRLNLLSSPFLSVRPGWFMERKLGVAAFASTHRRIAQAAPANHAEARLGGLRADSGESNLAYRCPRLVDSTVRSTREKEK